MLSGTRASIAVKIFGPDLYELRRLARQIETIAEGVEGTVDVAMEQQADVPQIRVEMRRLAMARFGVTPEHLAAAVDVAFAGEVVSQVLEEQQAFDLVVRFAPEYRGSLEAVRDARINTPVGSVVTLTTLADVRFDMGPNAISREDVQRRSWSSRTLRAGTWGAWWRTFGSEWRRSRSALGLLYRVRWSVRRPRVTPPAPSGS